MAEFAGRLTEVLMGRIGLLLIPLVLVAGCASGPWYWTKPGATRQVFLGDHEPCFKEATVGYSVGSEAVYKACMRTRGWTRVQGTGSQYPSVPHYRGPEDDDHFKESDQQRYRSQIGTEADWKTP